MSNATGTWTYTYDVSGLRTKRTNGTATYEYVYSGSQLIQMTKGSDTLTFAYDATGTPILVSYNGTVYYYVTTLQGDVELIMDLDGEIVVAYTYDAWGRILSTTGTMATTLGQLNPLRYRGYVYDTETGLYYLQSRYYNPTWGRFINADALVSTGQGLLGNNMFAYCLNNPVKYVDPKGNHSLNNYALDYFGWVGGEVGRFIYEYISDSEYGERVDATVEALAGSFELSAGIGVGLRLNATLAEDMIEADIGVSHDLLHFSMRDGKLSAGQRFQSGGSLSFLFLAMDGTDVKYKDYSETEWKADPATEAITLFEASFYFYGGGSLAINFYLNSFLEELRQIWIYP